MRLHNEPVARHFHKQLASVLRRWTGEDWQTSCCYSVKYRSGSILERHTDRKEVALTISVLIDERPRTDRPNSWPLHLVLADGKTKVFRLLPGEGVLFEGHKIAHYREELQRGHSSINIFFQFASAWFKGNLN
jgi:hypothetical protein